MANIPTYAQWMSETAGAFYERRNDHLKALDEAIKDYHEQGQTGGLRNRIQSLLDSYVRDHDRRKGDGSWKKSIRNANGSMERLMAALVTGPVPKVAEPPQIPPPAPPPPLPSRPIVSAEARKVIDELKLQFNYIKATPTQAILGPHTTTLETALTSLSTDLNKLYIDVKAAMERSRNNFKFAMDAGFNTFENLHKDDAEDIDFKLSIASKIFEAMKSLPFPLSTIGTMGAGIAGLAKTETFNRQSNSLIVAMPEPEGFKQMVADAAKRFNDLRTLNVAPAKLSGLALARERFFSDFRIFEDDLLESWKKKTRTVDDLDSRKKYAEQMVTTSLAKLRTDSEMRYRIEALRLEISALGKGVKAEFERFTRLSVIDVQEVGKWIAVQVIADYAVSGLCSGQDVKSMQASDLADKHFGGKFAEFLGSKDIGILQLNPADGTSPAIYATGKIPWAERPSHKVAIFLYLDWVQRNLNPFLLLRQDYCLEQFKELSRDYIQRLGLAIQAHQETHWFGHKTVSDVSSVASQAARPLPPTADDIFAEIPRM